MKAALCHQQQLYACEERRQRYVDIQKSRQTNQRSLPVALLPLSPATLISDFFSNSIRIEHTVSEKRGAFPIRSSGAA